MSENNQTLQDSWNTLADQFQGLTQQATELAVQTGEAANQAGAHGEPFLITGLTILILACFVGYHVVWRVTPALHSPLMGITNAISSVIIVGAVLATGTASVSGFSSILGFLAVIFASINIFGGFIITQRMLHMFKKKS